MSLRARLRGALSGAGFVALVISAVSVAARAQRIDAERPRTILVGTPTGSRTDQVNAARTGRVPLLPAGRLRIAWRASIGAVVDRAPLVDARGGSYVVGSRGEVVALRLDGVERWRVATNAAQPGPAALLSDDTVVFVAAGEAVAVRDGSVRWRVHFGRPDPAPSPSPLPLDNGGVVVATSRDLAVLDAEGTEWARASLPEPATSPLVLALGKVVAIAASGTVWTWAPGAASAERLATFGSAVDGGAALADERTLVAVTGGQTTLTAVDLSRGTVTTRATSRRGSWRGPPALIDGTACLLLLAPGSEQAITVDASGQELGRALLASRAQPAGIAGIADAGALPSGIMPIAVPAAPLASPLVDGNGTLAFSTPEGAVGVVAGLVIGASGGPGAGGPPAGDGAVELIKNACPTPFGTQFGGTPGSPPSKPVPAVVGLGPLPDRGLLVVCHSGSVLALTGGESPGQTL